MRLRYTAYVVSVLTASVGLTMLLPLGFSLYYNEGAAVPLLLGMCCSVVPALGVALATRPKGDLQINHREGMAIVTLGWTAAALAGALPFHFSGEFATFTDAMFESMSGFSTTGASVLTDIEALPKGLLMWRSLTHWLGGMGIIVLSLAILPFLGVGGMQLYKAEAPGPSPDKLTPRIKDTAMLLWGVYLLFTGVLIVLLLCGGMTFFDSVCHTFGTMATGGFSTKNASIGHYNSAYIDTVIVVFMFLAGVNFSLHFRLLKGKPQALWKDAEFRFYTFVILAFTLITTFMVWGDVYASFWQALDQSLFQVVSICTTTGYATADYELWHPLPQALLLLLMFLGGSAGSTGGGMKCMRILLLIKHSYSEIHRLAHPRAVQHVKLGGRIVPHEVLSGVWGYFILYLGLFIVSSFIMASMGLDVVTAFASVAACIGNIGPGLGTVGPAENYAHIPLAGKWLLLFCMLLGRLEIYTVIILLTPEFWRN